jgi:hypothetical protein
MVWDVACDDAGNSYLTGTFQATTLDLGIDTLVNTGSNNSYVLAHDGAGLPLWSAQISGGWAGSTGIATDGEGSVYVSGFYSNGSAQCGPFEVPQAVPGSIGNVLLAKLHAPEITTAVSGPRSLGATLYPNPTLGMLYMDKVPSTAVRFTVLDAAGQVAWTGTLRNGAADVRALGSGLYILRFIAEERVWSIPFVRE